MSGMFFSAHGVVTANTAYEGQTGKIPYLFGENLPSPKKDPHIDST